jgi:hypothetical protein
VRRLLLLLGLLLLTPTTSWAQDDDDSAGDDDDSAGNDDDSAGDDDSAREPEPEPDPRDLRIEQLEARLDAMEQQLKPKPQRRRRPTPKLQIKVGGRISSDVRIRIQEKAVGGWYDRRVLPIGFSRSENIAGLRLNASVSRFTGVADVDFVFTGLPEDPDGLPGLSSREGLHPYRFEAHGAYLSARDLLFRGFDLKFGYQMVQWGVGDQFNPTNVLNADDLEDPHLFGDQQANLMLKIDYTLLNVVTFSGVLVPIFRPALLPQSAQLGLADTSRMPFTQDSFRWRVHSEQEMGRRVLDHPTIVGSTRVELPETNLNNMQFAFRVAATIAQQDLSVMYYRGFNDFPIATRNVTTVDASYAGCELDPAPPAMREGEPGEDEDCIDGVLSTETTLSFPRMQVIGINLTGEIPEVGIGYRAEVGVFFPERRTMRIYNPELAPFVSAGEYDYDGDGESGGGEPPEVLSDKVFAKWTLGLDYRIGGHVMLNAQWVHGMVDEFGAGDFVRPEWGEDVRYGEAIGWTPAEADGRPVLLDCATGGVPGQCAKEIVRPKLADYLVFGVDVSFAREAGLFRLFTLWDLSGYTEKWFDISAGTRTSEHHHPFSKKGFSAVLYPTFMWDFGYGFEVEVGALIKLGQDHTKFGDPAAGGSEVFLKGRYLF